MMHTVRGFGTVLATAALISGCLGGGGGGGNNGDGDSSGTIEPDLAQLLVDTADAQGFVVTDGVEAVSFPGPSVSAADDGPDLDPGSLYKVTLGGKLEKITPTDSAGEELPSGTIQPDAVAELTGRFAVMRFVQTGSTGESRLYYLVDLHSGRAYLEDGDIRALRALGEEHYLDSFEGIGENVRTDEAGYLYLPCQPDPDSIDAGYCRIDTTHAATGGDVTLEEISRDLGSFHSHLANLIEVSGDGKFIVYTGKDSNGQTVHRLRPVSGSGFDNVGAWEIEDKLFRDLNGGVYTLDGGDLLRFDLGEDESTGGPSAEVENLGTFSGSWPTRNWKLSRVVGGKHLVIQRSRWGWEAHQPDDLLLEMDLPNREGRIVNEVLDEFDEIFRIETNERFVFAFGSRSDGTRIVLRWAPATGDIEVFDQLANNYELEKFRVVANDVIWFQAVRQFDDATIIGELAVNGSVTELETISAAIPNIDRLIPINPAHFIVIDGYATDWPDELILLSGDTGAEDVKRIGVARDRETLKMLIDLTAYLDTGLRIIFGPDNDNGGEYHLRYSEENGLYELFTPDSNTQPLDGSTWLLVTGAATVELVADLHQLGNPSDLEITVELGVYEVDDGVFVGFAPKQGTDTVSFAVD